MAVKSTEVALEAITVQNGILLELQMSIKQNLFHLRLWRLTPDLCEGLYVQGHIKKFLEFSRKI